MWPFLRGEIVEALKRNDDVMFELQTSQGLALVMLFFLLIITFLVYWILGRQEPALVLLGVELVVAAYIAWGYVRVTNWRAQWELEHVVPEEAPTPLDRSLRVISNWRKHREPNMKVDAPFPAPATA